MNIEYRLYLLLIFRFLLFRAMHTGYHTREIRQVDHADSLHTRVRFVIRFLIRARCTAQPKAHISKRKSRVIHRIKRPLHTVLADTDIARNADQRTSHRLGSAADIAMLPALCLICVLRICMLRRAIMIGCVRSVHDFLEFIFIII